MLTKATTLTIAITALSSVASGLGINCRGSALCSNHNALKLFAGASLRIDKNRQYQNGEKIMCQSLDMGKGTCLFLQGTNGGLPGSAMSNLILSLIGHECQQCGSVPIGFPGSNDPGNGILTSNFVSDTGGCVTDFEQVILC